MAETERTFAELQLLLADNTTQAISAQDLRDLMVSVLGGYAMLFVENNVATQALDATPAVVTAFDTIGPQKGAAASFANNTITIGAAGDYEVHVSLSLEVSGGPSSDVAVAPPVLLVGALRTARLRQERPDVTGCVKQRQFTRRGDFQATGSLPFGEVPPDLVD